MSNKPKIAVKQLKTVAEVTEHLRNMMQSKHAELETNRRKFFAHANGCEGCQEDLCTPDDMKPEGIKGRFMGLELAAEQILDSAARTLSTGVSDLLRIAVTTSGAISKPGSNLDDHARRMVRRQVQNKVEQTLAVQFSCIDQAVMTLARLSFAAGKGEKDCYSTKLNYTRMVDDVETLAKVGVYFGSEPGDPEYTSDAELFDKVGDIVTELKDRVTAGVDATGEFDFDREAFSQKFKARVEALKPLVNNEAKAEDLDGLLDSIADRMSGDMPQRVIEGVADAILSALEKDPTGGTDAEPRVLGFRMDAETGEVKTLDVNDAPDEFKEKVSGMLIEDGVDPAKVFTASSKVEKGATHTAPTMRQ